MERRSDFNSAHSSSYSQISPTGYVPLGKIFESPTLGGSDWVAFFFLDFFFFFFFFASSAYETHGEGITQCRGPGTYPAPKEH